MSWSDFDLFGLTPGSPICVGTLGFGGLGSSHFLQMWHRQLVHRVSFGSVMKADSQYMQSEQLGQKPVGRSEVSVSLHLVQVPVESSMLIFFPSCVWEPGESNPPYPKMGALQAPVCPSDVTPVSLALVPVCGSFAGWALRGVLEVEEFLSAVWVFAPVTDRCSCRGPGAWIPRTPRQKFCGTGSCRLCTRLPWDRDEGDSLHDVQSDQSHYSHIPQWVTGWCDALFGYVSLPWPSGCFGVGLRRRLPRAG